jgi:predicted DNA binding CopG/RHH family protein
MPFESSEPATGGKERGFMTKRIKYTEGPIEEVKVIRDFLPPPEELAFREELVKVTIGLSKSSVEFFKKEAKKYHTQYQKMIRRLLDLYVAQHKKLR